MLGIVSYAFTVFSKLRSDSVVFKREKPAINRFFQTFCYFSRTMNRLNPKLFFLELGHLKGCFGKRKKKSIFFTSVLRFSIFSENGS